YSLLLFLFLIHHHLHISTLFPYTTLFRSHLNVHCSVFNCHISSSKGEQDPLPSERCCLHVPAAVPGERPQGMGTGRDNPYRSLPLPWRDRRRGLPPRSG